MIESTEILLADQKMHTSWHNLIQEYQINLFPDDCSRYIASATGSITSPGHPVSYPSNKDCTWVISVGSGKQFALMFTTFDVKRGSSAQGCQEDFVEVRNGLSDISHQIGGKYCNALH